MISSILNYQIIKKIGESMQADVYQVTALDNDDTGSSFVLKHIKAQFCNAELAHYLQQQVEQLSALKVLDSIVPSVESPNSEIICLIQPWFSYNLVVPYFLYLNLVHF